jgi:hypothetical protein
MTPKQSGDEIDTEIEIPRYVHLLLAGALFIPPTVMSINIVVDRWRASDSGLIAAMVNLLGLAIGVGGILALPLRRLATIALVILYIPPMVIGLFIYGYLFIGHVYGEWPLLP